MSTAFQIIAGIAILVLATLHGLARLIEAVSATRDPRGKVQVDDDKTVVIRGVAHGKDDW